MVVLLPKQDVLLERIVQDPGLLGHVGKSPAGRNAALQQGHLERTPQGRGGEGNTHNVLPEKDAGKVRTLTMIFVKAAGLTLHNI